MSRECNPYEKKKRYSKRKPTSKKKKKKNEAKEGGGKRLKGGETRHLIKLHKFIVPSS